VARATDKDRNSDEGHGRKHVQSAFAKTLKSTKKNAFTINRVFALTPRTTTKHVTITRTNAGDVFAKTKEYTRKCARITSRACAMANTFEGVITKMMTMTTTTTTTKNNRKKSAAARVVAVATTATTAVAICCRS
jgi:hypothetical protein